ncbi:plasmid mobilization relaxosome protein MobC [Sphingobacterium spiritivorum]|uniref:plasmid mobilization protein n=1 Tax=Sphingobacterium spiritivorum TaxID=258 RepID=UPI00191A41B9|nr:plasmid mobilization relaxosome protein MobC [Sphingobacterium spiritivorum]QQT24497.1 plasmid mobilization relaxosome protein MobC [Sphingobacterium spiritivorum]
MSGRTSEKQRRHFTHPIRTRVNKETYERLENLLAQSTCQSMGELARKLITREKINCTYRDITMNAPMEELSSIRKELKAIGININQITRTFNQEKTKENSRQNYVMQIAELYKKVDIKVERLLTLISQLTEKWLQG